METYKKLETLAAHFQASGLTRYEALRISAEIEKIDVLRNAFLAAVSKDQQPLEAIATQLGYGERRPTLPDIAQDIIENLGAINTALVNLEGI